MKANSHLIGWMLLTAGALLSVAAPVQAQRYAVVIGSNHGAPSEPVLRFAQTDARRVAQVLRELGRVQPEHLFLLLDPEPEAVRTTLARIERRVAGDPERAALVFYYSGHADADALHLGGDDCHGETFGRRCGEAAHDCESASSTPVNLVCLPPRAS